MKANFANSRRTLISLAFALGFGFVPLSSAQAQAASSSQDSIVVLLDLSGFRWDYVTRDGAKNLLALAKSGVSAPTGMLPAFPASTWPNAWTLVTGLYPGHHGIVADEFYDPAMKAEFSAGNANTVSDGAWFGGVPLWSLAEKQGIKSGCINWPGCAAKTAASGPSLLPTQAKTSAGAVGQIISWLRQPTSERPRLILAFLSEVSVAARRYGPDAAETRTAVRGLDDEIGKLRSAIDTAHLPVDLVIVSDHGMANSPADWVTLDAQANLTGMRTAGTLLYGSTEAQSEAAYNALKKAAPEFVAYRLKNTPADLHLYANPRFGDPVVIATSKAAIRMHASADPLPKAIDGLNAHAISEMKGIFFAAGPDIVKGKTVASFENVHIYPWIAHLLGLTPPKNDGSLNLLSGTLRDDGGDKQE